jgi:hypothetical protein
VAILLISGCVLTPKQELYNSQLAFLGTVNTLNILKEADRFNEKEVAEITVFINSGFKIIDKWAETGINPEFADAFRTVLTELTVYKIKGKTNAE